MAIQKELWTDYIMGNLFKNNEFLNYAFNADQHVLAGKVVHIPQAGAKPGVKKNRTELPAAVTRRTDVDVTYAIDEYTLNPTLIPNADTIELSYDKMDSVMTENMETLQEFTAEGMLYNWRVEDAAYILRTTGPAVAATASGATGNRKKLLKEDLKRAQALMNKLNISRQDRYALIPSDLYSQLLDDADLMKRDNSKELDLPNGVVMRLYGFNLMERSKVLIYTNAATPVAKDPDPDVFVEAATDNDAILCWQKNCVERALGTVDFFEDLGNPLYYGDIYSGLVRMGGRKRRQDAKGVVAIVQDSAA